MTVIGVAPFMRAWQRNRLASRPFVPRPEDAPLSQAPGPDPDRILLIGTGPAVGWGVRTHDLALPGFMARELASLTGRGAAVEVRAASDESMGDVRHLLAGARAWRYDAVVLIGGIHDAVSLTAVRRWRQMMGSLIAELESETSPDSPIMVIGMPPATSVSTYAPWPGVLADRHALRLNLETEAICSTRDRVFFVQGPTPSEGPRAPGTRGARLYREVARSIAESLAPIVSTPRPGVARARRAQPDPEAERQRSVEALHILGSGRDSRFDRITALAKETFHSEIAAVTIIDDDRQCYKSIVGLDLDEIPRSVSFCTKTIAADGPLVYGDLSKEAEFAGFPLVNDQHIRFYAGYPIESPDGYRIGALCVMDSRPRDASTVDGAALRDLAQLVQREIWSIAAPLAALATR